MLSSCTRSLSTTRNFQSFTLTICESSNGMKLRIQLWKPKNVFTLSMMAHVEGRLTSTRLTLHQRRSWWKLRALRSNELSLMKRHQQDQTQRDMLVIYHDKWSGNHFLWGNENLIFSHRARSHDFNSPNPSGVITDNERCCSGAKSFLIIRAIFYGLRQRFSLWHPANCMFDW